MRVADFDMAIDDHGFADESHWPHADIVAHLLEFQFQRGDLRVRVPVAHRAQAGRLLAEGDGNVLAAAEPDADDGRLAGETAAAELVHHIEEEPLNAVDAVAGEQHPVIGAEQPALVDGGHVDPLGVGLEGILDLGRVDADIVVVVLTRQRVHPVGAQRDRMGGIRRGAAQRALQSDGAAFDPGLVADLHEIARHAGIRAHGAAVGLGGFPVVEHRHQNEAGKFLFLLFQHAAQTVAVVLRNVDSGVRHDLHTGAVNGLFLDHLPCFNPAP